MKLELVLDRPCEIDGHAHSMGARVVLEEAAAMELLQRGVARLIGRVGPAPTPVAAPPAPPPADTDASSAAEGAPPAEGEGASMAPPADAPASAGAPPSTKGKRPQK